MPLHHVLYVLFVHPRLDVDVVRVEACTWSLVAVEHWPCSLRVHNAHSLSLLFPLGISLFVHVLERLLRASEALYKRL